MEMISPSEEQKNRMFEKAEMMAEKSYAPAKRKGRVIKIACCTAAAAAIIGTTTVFADDIKSVFYGLFGNESIISEDIIENVYEDTDSHIDFSVSKVVSDRINSYAIVKYTALDDEGAKWLDKAFTKEVFYEENRDAHYDSDGNIVTHSNDMLDLTITPKGYDGHYVSYSYGLTNDDEITHESEENTRVFRVKCNAADIVFDTDVINLNYIMPNGVSKTVPINVSESIELIDIKLDSSKAAENYYIPTGVKLSPLGIMVYGMNNGLYDYTKGENGSSIWVIPDEPALPSVEIVTKDGSEIPLNHPWSLCSVIEPEKDYEVAIFTDYFEEPVDPDNIAGIILDDVYYEF